MRRTKCWMWAAALSGMMFFPGSNGAQVQTKGVVVRFVLINMSGQRREARLRKTVVELPVAELVPMQAVAGDRIAITSETSSRMDKTLTISTADEGRVIPVQ